MVCPCKRSFTAIGFVGALCRDHAWERLRLRPHEHPSAAAGRACPLPARPSTIGRLNPARSLPGAETANGASLASEEGVVTVAICAVLRDGFFIGVQNAFCGMQAVARPIKGGFDGVWQMRCAAWGFKSSNVTCFSTMRLSKRAWMPFLPGQLPIVIGDGVETET